MVTVNAGSDAAPPLGANYRRLWSSSALSNLADGVFVVALPLLAAGLTDAPALVAGVVAIGRLPWLLVVLIAGALADRLDRRLTMRNVELVRAGVAAVLVVLAATDRLGLGALAVAAFVVGTAEVIRDTTAQTIVPALVPGERLATANGRLYAVEVLMNQFVGPPLGGVLVALSVPLALGGISAAWVGAAIGLVLLQGTFRPARTSARPSIVADVREGLRYLWSQRVLRSLAIMVGVINLVLMATQAILVLFALDASRMGLDEVGYGLLLTAFAVGAIAGSLVAERIERRLGRSRTLFACVAVVTLATLVPALTPLPIAVATALALTGLMSMVWNIITVSLRQRIAPDALLGRVNAGYRLFAWGTMPLGAILGGLVAQLVGFEAVFALGALVVGSLLALRPRLTDAALAAAERAVA